MLSAFSATLERYYLHRQQAGPSVFHGQHNQKSHGRKGSGADFNREVEEYTTTDNWPHSVFVKHTGYTDADKAALNGYAGGSLETLDRTQQRNRSLREGNDPIDDDIALTNAINKGELTEDVTLYRGVTGDVADQMIHGELDEFVDLGFVSTTTKQRYAEDWVNFNYESVYDTRAVMRVHARKGTKANSFDVAHNLKESGQSEVIIQRGTRFRVLGVDDDWWEADLDEPPLFRIVDVEVIGQ